LSFKELLSVASEASERKDARVDGWGGIDVPLLTNQIERVPWYLCHFNFRQTIGDDSTLLREG
jgi:hypothetical protein